MAAESTTPNFFILLDLNPDDAWDEGKFEQAMRTKRIEWGRERNIPGAKGIEAQKKLQLLSEISRLGTDLAFRNAQAAAAKAELASGRKLRLEKFERQLRMAEEKGYLEKAELTAFINDFKDVLSEQEITRRVKVEVRKPVEQNKKQEHQIEASTLKAISEKLQTINMTSLYQLLEKGETTDSQVLCDAADRLFNEMVSRMPKTAEVTVKGELAGYAKDIFKSKQKREEYDESLRLRSLDALLKELDENIARQTDKEVHVRQIERFLQATRKAGWKDEEALARLKEHARQRRWFLQIPTIDMSTQQQRCGYCHEINEKERNFCRKCNKELNINCPNCGGKVPADEVGCSGCGFPVGNRYWIDDSLEKCRYLLTKLDLKGAQELLSEIERGWTVSKPDARMQKIRECKTETQRLVQEQQQTVAQLRQLVDRRQFYTVRQFLATHTQDIADRATYQQMIENAITQARELLKRAQSSTISRDETIELCRQALRVCADFKDARDLLSTAPPTPPRNVQAKVGGTMVSLTWELSPTRAVNYKIVRKARSQPVSVKDGTLLETVTGQIYDDTRPEIGLPLYYAVFAECEGIVSLQGTTLAQPVLLTQDVTHETVEVNDRQVDLSWHVPPNIYKIVVVRKEQAAPRAMNDGTPISLLDSSHVADRDVQNDHVYFYAIYCQFKDHEGGVRTSPGKIISAKPETPPSPITRLQISHTQIGQGYEVQLRWAPPAKGQVVILKSKQQIPLAVGRVIAKSQLGQYGSILQGGQDALSDTWARAGIEYYTPIVLLHDTAYIGTCQRYICIEDIRDLKCTNLGTALRLQWTWPTNCQEALVSYSYQDWPEASERAANTRKVTRAEYEHIGHYDLKGTTSEQDYYIVVAAIVRQGNDQVITQGAQRKVSLRSKIVLTYEIKNPNFMRKKRTLHLFARTPGIVPPFLLVSKRDRLPFKKTEGDTFFAGNEMQIEKELVIELPDKTFPPRTFGKLFLQDDSMYDVVNINHPSEDKLRLS